MEKIREYLDFIRETENLKSTLRTAWTARGRQESTAEHSWRLALLAGVFLEEYPCLDAVRVYQLCLVHDLGEIYDGDISAALRPDEELKHKKEKQSVEKVFSLLPGSSGKKWLDIWREYDENLTPEAHLVKALDKAETIIQHNQGRNPEDFDYEFNLEYGRKYFEADELLRELRRELDAETRCHIPPESKE
ncbi:HD domain-containing protein [Murimonas intestini]|uniref:HD domain-containing protein n=1 Tax=Murimonas intestini TaxID=1337051 RepID=UPI00248B6D0C|nr:HD domain-containing protein [Murimonas intestini]